MADEQGLSEPDGFFARQVLGKAVKSLVANVGVDGRRLVPRSSAPSNPEAGDMYLQDGTNWDPVGNAGNAAVIVYNGTSWVLDTDLGTAL